MGGRAWSQEELIQLEELTETYPLATVARKLNRSENAVFLKRQRTGIGGFMANTDMLTRNTLSRILGVENRTIQYWERKGLKSVRKKPYVMYRQQDIIRYMKEHPEDWNAARVTDDTLFMQYPWFKEKRKNDISHKYNWTQTEVSQMKMLRKQGFTIREIAEMMIDEDIPSQGYGDYIYSLQDKVKYSKRGEAYLQERGLDFFEVLREQGLGELIKETVNAGSLQSAMKEIAEENDGELPPELDEVVSSYEMTDIARRKSTNKALKRAKGE